MDPRLKKNRHTLLLQKRTFISDHELYEMMRSRHVYYVQTELTKQLDRTLKSLKQAEKIKLVGFRLQKTMFLKRMAFLEKRMRHVNSIPAAGDNYFHDGRLDNEISSISEIVAKRREISDFASSNEDNAISPFGQSNNTMGMSRKEHGNDDHGEIQVRADTNNLHPRSRKEMDDVKSSINSGWMCSIHEEIKKAGLNDATKSENTSLLQGRETKYFRGDKISKLILESECSQTSPKPGLETNSQHLNGHVDLQNGATGSSKVNNHGRRIQLTGMVKSRLVTGHLDRNRSKFESNRASRESIHGVNDRTHTKEWDELSVANDLRNLSLSDHDILGRGRNSDHTMSVSSVVSRKENLVNQKVCVQPLQQLSVLDQVMKSSTKDKSPCQDEDNNNTVSLTNKTTKLTKPVTTEAKNTPSNHNTSSKMNNSTTKQRLLLPPQITPYLGRSRSLPTNKAGILPKNKERHNSGPLSEKLERTVTMIFVEDPDDGKDRPKSQFDFEAWLSYNKRKRGYTKIFDETFSTFAREDTSNETDTAVSTLESKRGPKSNVHFDFSRTRPLRTDKKPLTFREKSQEWYLNFLQVKHTKRNSSAHQNSQRHGKPGARAANRWGYTLLPGIGSHQDRYIISGGGSLANADSKLSISTGSHFLLKETADQRLQRLKDHSKILQIKVNNFVCS